jgi:hypothetical protein
VNRLCSKVVTGILGLFKEECQRTGKVVRSSLDILCDIQVVTGTAILIAGIVQRDSLTFYHQQFVMSYWSLTLISFWAARSGKLQSHEENGDDDNEWHFWTRLFFIFISSVLSLYYQLVTIPNQKDEWDPLTSGFCFIYHDKSDYQQNFFWVAGLIIFAVYILLLLLSGLTACLIGFDKSWMDIARQWTSEHQRDYHRRYEMWRFSILNKSRGVGEFELHPPAGTPPSDHLHIGSPHSATLTPTTEPCYENRLQRYAATIILYIPFFVEWAFLRFFALWAWGTKIRLPSSWHFSGSRPGTPTT